MSYILETIRWREGRVRILDQTRLPQTEVYRTLSRVDEVIDAIRTLAVRGAPALGVAGAMGVALALQEAARNPAHSAGRDGSTTGSGTAGPPALNLPAERLLQVAEEAARRLSAARPTAVNLRWGCDRVLEALREKAGATAGDPLARSADLVNLAQREAAAILEDDLSLSMAMASHGFPLLPAEGRVLTHCNTGGLATAGGGTALGVVLHAVENGKRLFVHVDETRPWLQGARLTAWELQRAGVPFAIQADGAAAWLMRSTRIDAVLVGADRVAANGDTANKVGTLMLALAARQYGVPFYVVAPRSSFDLSFSDGDAIPIEERPEAEVLAWGGTQVAPAGAHAWNPAFDVTPARLVTAWVTERGVEHPPFAP